MLLGARCPAHCQPCRPQATSTPGLVAEPDPAGLALPGPPLTRSCSCPRPRPLHEGLSFGVGVSTQAECWHLLLSHFNCEPRQAPLVAAAPTVCPALGPGPPLHRPQGQRWVTVLKRHPALAACDTRGPAQLGFRQTQPGFFLLLLPSGQVCARAQLGRVPCSSCPSLTGKGPKPESGKALMASQVPHPPFLPDNT